MTASAELPRLHVVTDDAVLCAADFEAVARRLLERAGESLALHVRGPGLSGGEVFRLTAALLPAAEAGGGMLLVNDRVDVALAAGAHGAQLGARSLPVVEARAVLGPGERRRLGVSVHEAAEAARAGADGADFVLAGTVYRTASHPGREGGGTALVSEVAAEAGVPVVAIGGITPERAAEVLRAGAWGVAVLGGVWRAADPPGALDRYRVALEQWSEGA